MIDESRTKIDVTVRLRQMSIVVVLQSGLIVWYRRIRTSALSAANAGLDSIEPHHLCSMQNLTRLQSANLEGQLSSAPSFSLRFRRFFWTGCFVFCFFRHRKGRSTRARLH